MPNMVIEIEKRHHRGKSINDTFKKLIDLGYFGYFVYDKSILKIEQFNSNIMQDERYETNKNVYVNNFIFSRLPAVKLTI